MSRQSEIKEVVRAKYAQIARGESSCCSAATSSCCSSDPQTIVDLSHGYDQAEMQSMPEGANLGLGCGNPLSLVDVQPGWKVLDLGSGGGVDVFLAAKRVGESGYVTGLDMTDEMLEKAWANARTGGYTNVSFVKGEIESMPFPDKSFDFVISNCVLNLVPDKARAYQEILRVLKPGGFFAVADIAVRGEMPTDVRKSAEAWAGCVAGALDLDKYIKLVKSVGFEDVDTGFVNEYDYGRTEQFALLSVGLVGRRPKSA